MEKENGKSSFLIALGEELKAIRGKRTLQEVADQGGFGASYLWEIENGNRSPKMETYKSIADALGIKLSDLFSRVDNREEMQPLYGTMAEAENLLVELSDGGEDGDGDGDEHSHAEHQPLMASSEA